MRRLLILTVLLAALPASAQNPPVPGTWWHACDVSEGIPCTNDGPDHLGDNAEIGDQFDVVVDYEIGTLSNFCELQHFPIYDTQYLMLVGVAPFFGEVDIVTPGVHGETGRCVPAQFSVHATESDPGDYGCAQALQPGRLTGMTAPGCRSCRWFDEDGGTNTILWNQSTSVPEMRYTFEVVSLTPNGEDTEIRFYDQIMTRLGSGASNCFQNTTRYFSDSAEPQIFTLPEPGSAALASGAVLLLALARRRG